MLTVITGGKIYEGFSDVKIFKTLNSVSSSFYLRYRLNPENIQRVNFERGSSVEIKINKELILTGYIDAVQTDISSEMNQLQIYGRSKTCDLVDCSLLQDPGEFKDQTLMDLIKKFISPFNISVNSEVGDGGKFEKWSISPGETVWENLEKATRIKGLLLTGTPEGNLSLSTIKSTQERTQLIEGENIVNATKIDNESKRYSEYIVKGQSPDLIVDAQGEALDSSIKRHRPLLILSEAPVNTSAARKRAEWENIIRAMRGEDLTITVNDWLTTPEGSTWNINKTTKVISPSLSLNQEFLITGVAFILEQDKFRKTEITLERTDAFQAKKEV